jgi:hypothetical protein
VSAMLQERVARRVELAARRARAKARVGQVFYGNAQQWELSLYTTDVVLGDKGVRVMLTRDGGMHSGGWFKNPDYERCWHLSLSFRTPDGLVPLPRDPALSRQIVAAVFGGASRMLWVEGPKHPDRDIAVLDVWHYRLMCDEHWRPIIPRGEVYSKEFTERGWRSFSEIHGRKPIMVQEA